MTSNKILWPHSVLKNISFISFIVEKRRGIMLENVDRAYRIKCAIKLIGGVRSEIGLLAWMMRSND